jgi:hypothetical protein
LIAASTVFIVTGISAIVHIPRRSAVLPLPFDQQIMRYFSSAFFNRLRRLGSKMLGPFPVGDQLGGKTAKRAFRRLVQQQGLKCFGRGFVSIIDRCDDLRLPHSIGLLVVSREHGLPEAPKECDEPGHLVIRPGVEDGDTERRQRSVILSIEFAEPPSRRRVSNRFGFALGYQYAAREQSLCKPQAEFRAVGLGLDVRRKHERRRR